MLSARIQPNSEKPTAQRFTAQMDDDWKQTTRATQKLLNVFKWLSQSADLIRRARVLFTQDQTKVGEWEKHQVKTAAVGSWQSINHEEAWHAAAAAICLRFQGVIRSNWFPSRLLKKNLIITFIHTGSSQQVRASLRSWIILTLQVKTRHLCGFIMYFMAYSYF